MAMGKADESLRSTRLVFYKEDIEKIAKVLNTFLKNANARCVLLVDKDGHLVTKEGESSTYDMDTISATILVIEDHDSTRTFLADNLSADGFDPLEAESAEEGRRLMRTQFPDLAIVDLGLPDCDGLELVHEVRTTDRIAGSLDPDLPLLVLTGRGNELDRLRA